MRKVELRAMEQMKYEIIKNLVTNSGNKLNASNKLGISVRQVNRLIIRYKEEGKEGFIHGNRKKSPTLTISKETKETILSLYNNKYYNFNFKHFKEMLEENENIKISYNSLYKILDKKTHLHAAIDDATGMIVGAYFDYHETLNGYYNVLKQTLDNHGIPNEFLTDRRTIFEYNLLKNPEPEYSTLTQFGYACEQLGITLSVTSIPQAKGRIERLFGTLQSRLINELRINNINTISKANEFLQSYVDKFNKQFSLMDNNIPQVYENINSDTDLNLILALVTNRVFDRGSALKYQNKYFQAYNKHGDLVNFKYRTKVVVIKSFDNKLYCLINQEYYKLVELESHERYSKEFDFEVKKEKKKYAIPDSHPWKRESYDRMIARTAYKSR